MNQAPADRRRQGNRKVLMARERIREQILSACHAGQRHKVEELAEASTCRRKGNQAEIAPKRKVHFARSIGAVAVDVAVDVAVAVAVAESRLLVMD